MASVEPSVRQRPRSQRTRDRILEGARRAVAMHGLGKLDMAELGRSAGVSRGTLYRYFPSREALLAELSLHEALRFWKGCLDALQSAPEAARIPVLIDQANRQVREHAALQRILETDPALVLRAVQEEFPRIRAQLERLLAPQLGSVVWVRRGQLAPAALADWIARLMISAFLIPAEDPGAMPRDLTALFRALGAGRPAPPEDSP